MGKQRNECVVNLFWTGGWDSTYRLLDLILVHKLIVQPHYLIDPERRSMRLELAAMEKVTKELLQKDSRSKELLLPAKYAEVASIKKNSVITNAYERLFKRVPLGIQYEWMARYCDENKIEGMELSIEQGDSRFNTFIEPLVSKVSCAGNNFFYRIDEKYEGEEEYEVFRYFKFPVLHLSRLEMEEHSKEVGFYTLLEQSWFCHNPINNKACGICDPCITTINQGQLWRISFIGQVRYYLYVKSGLRKLRKNIANHS